MRTISTTSTLAPMATITSFPTTRSATHSPWHSPIPYLFGGLAAMLGLIAFALLMLACSYWRLSTQSQNQQGGDNARDMDKEGDDPQKKETSKAYEEKVLVIMAGDENPTFLATPVCPMFGKYHGKDCDRHLGNHESTFDVSEEETMDNDNNHFVVRAAITTHENEGAQETQQEQQQNQ